jgi:recombination protein RecA
VAKKELPKDDPLSLAMQSINKSQGSGTIRRLSEAAADIGVTGISSGILSLDIALGGKGFPRGRITELIGAESSGKTTIALSTIAQCQKLGESAALIDAEHALDPVWARRLGVDQNEILLCQPNDAEQGLQVVEDLIRSQSVGVIVIDSVAALVPRAELDGDMGDAHVGRHARLMNQALRKLTGIAAQDKTVIIFINQIREKIGITFGSPNTTPGGKGLKFFASCRVEVNKIKTLKTGSDESGTAIGIRSRAKVIKNKIAAAYQQADFNILGSCGIDFNGDVFDMALEGGLIDAAGSHYSFRGQKLGNGRANSLEFLSNNDDLVAAIRSLVISSKMQPES